MKQEKWEVREKRIEQQLQEALARGERFRGRVAGVQDGQTQESARAPEGHNAEPAGRAQRLETTGVQRIPPPLIKCPEAVSRGEQLSIQSSLQFAHTLNSIYPMASATVT